MSGPLRRNAEEILEALESAAHVFKRTLRDRQRSQADRLREQNRTVRDTEDAMEPPSTGRYTDGPIHELDVGSYGNLSNRARRHSRNDGIEHDHIPSRAALVAARQREVAPRRLTSAEIRDIENSAVAVALRNDLHAFSRTYRNRNDPDQIALDAQDLARATERDLEMLRISLTVDGGYTPREVNAVLQTIRDLNALLGR